MAVQLMYPQLLDLYSSAFWDYTKAQAVKLNLPNGYRMAEFHAKYFLTKDAELPKIFFVSDMEENIEQGIEFDTLEDQDFVKCIDLPFKCCLFQPTDSCFTELTARVADLGEEQRPIVINSVLALEVSAQNYVFGIAAEGVKVGNTPASISVVAYDTPKESMRALYQMLKICVQKTCQYIAKKKTDKGQATMYHYVKHAGQGKKVKIKKVIYVGKRKTIEAQGNRSVDWSHKWLVSGHWRDIKGIGKDRDGKYVEKDRTWVVPHKKGKGVLVDKIRKV